MPEHELVGQLIAHVGHVKVAVFIAYHGIKHHMFEHIAQLFAYIGRVVLHQRVAKFKNFLYRIGAQALISLLLVPRTFFSQPVLHIKQSAESLHLLLAGMLILHNAKIAFFSH